MKERVRLTDSPHTQATAAVLVFLLLLLLPYEPVYHSATRLQKAVDVVVDAAVAAADLANHF